MTGHIYPTEWWFVSPKLLGYCQNAYKSIRFCVFNNAVLSYLFFNVKSVKLRWVIWRPIRRHKVLIINWKVFAEKKMCLVIRFLSNAQNFYQMQSVCLPKHENRERVINCAWLLICRSLKWYTFWVPIEISSSRTTILNQSHHAQVFFNFHSNTGCTGVRAETRHKAGS